MKKILAALLVLASITVGATSRDEFAGSKRIYDDWEYFQKSNSSGSSTASTVALSSTPRQLVSLAFTCNDENLSTLGLAIYTAKSDGYFKYVKDGITTIWVDNELLSIGPFVRGDNRQLVIVDLDTSVPLQNGTELKVKLEIPKRKTAFFTFSLVGFTYAINQLPGKGCTN